MTSAAARHRPGRCVARGLVLALLTLALGLGAGAGIAAAAGGGGASGGSGSTLTHRFPLGTQSMTGTAATRPPATTRTAGGTRTSRATHPSAAPRPRSTSGTDRPSPYLLALAAAAVLATLGLALVVDRRRNQPRHGYGPRTPRPRHRVGSPVILLLSPLMRYSPTRDAYVLRLVGRRHGPVLVRRPSARPAPRPPTARPPERAVTRDPPERAVTRDPPEPVVARRR